MTAPTRRPLLCVAAAVALAFAGAAPAAAQCARPELALDLLDWSTPGLRATLACVGSLSDDRARWKLDIDAPFALDPDENPETVQAALSLGMLLLDLGQEEDLTGPPGAMGRDRGALRIGVEAAAEAGQRFEQTDLALGLVALYDHATTAFWYLPAAALAWDLVRCFGCEALDTDDEDYHRVDLDLGWSIDLENFSPSLASFRLRPGGRLFRAWGVGPALEELRNDEGLWGRVQLAWFRDTGVLHEVYVGWRGGDLPVRLEEASAVYLGLTLNF